jgi:SAM-dependent methyltransferase
MSETCELCRRVELIHLYEPSGSIRIPEVYLCNHCGLVQSLPRAGAPGQPAARNLSDADRGGLRCGAASRTQAALAALGRHVDLNADISVLDAASDRGSFTRAIVQAAPLAVATAVEPNGAARDAYADIERTELIGTRIEDTPLESERFDVVHSCRAIGHLAEPSRVLADHWRVLKPGGLLILNMPNIASLDSDDIVEEWFADKGFYHFSARTLMRLVSAAGFVIVAAPDLLDRENLLIVARKMNSGARPLLSDSREVSEALRLISLYQAARARNIAALTFVAAEIAAMKPARVALWGAGALFDSLVIQGGLAPAGLSHLVDKYLLEHVTSRHGAVLEPPEALLNDSPEIVIVLSRRYAEEIAAEARMLLPRAQIITYSDLLHRANLRKAA